MTRRVRVKPPKKVLTDAEKAVRRAKRAVNAARQQQLVTTLLRALQGIGIPIAELTREVDFYGPKSSHPWRFDLAFEDRRIAIEIDGGSWGGKPCPLCGERPGGRHSRGGREKERLKLNTAAAYGWRVLSFTSTTIDRKPYECAALIAEAYRCG